MWSITIVIDTQCDDQTERLLDTDDIIVDTDDPVVNKNTFLISRL